MKKTIFLLTLVGGMLALDSCKKYPEGPMISFRSRTARVANTWKMNSVKEDGTDITSYYTNINYTETFTKDGVYSYSFTGGSGSGKWAFESSDTQIKVNGVSGQSSQDLTIKKLKEKEFWYTYTDNGHTYEVHLVPN